MLETLATLATALSVICFNVGLGTQAAMLGIIGGIAWAIIAYRVKLFKLLGLNIFLTLSNLYGVFTL